jgi:hypothetical protein
LGRAMPVVSIACFLIVHPLGDEHCSWGLFGVRDVWA